MTTFSRSPRRRGVISTIAFVAIVLLATPGGAQSLTEERGFVDFERFGDFDLDDLAVEVNLGGGILRMLSTTLEEVDEELAGLMESLKSIRVNIFESDGDNSPDQMKSAIRDLQRDGWEAIVRIAGDEDVNILVRYDDELILGLLATFSDADGSFGFVNIVGDFDPEQIGRLASQFNIEALEGLDLEGEREP